MGIHGMHLILGFLLETVAGTPEWLPHPVRLIGRLITGLERLIRKQNFGPAGLKAAGVVLAVVTAGLTGAAAWLILRLAWMVSPYLFALIDIMLIYTCLSMRCLFNEARSVYEALHNGDLILARNRVARIVGRDTENLTQEDVIRATVETVAENSADGIISPLFYLLIGGPVLGLAYKAVNTLDSMVGYQNDEYRDLGWASAKLDDLANWLPARITGVMIALAGLLWGKNPARALRIFLRDRKNHRSPNSGHPEAAMAGLLGVRLGGNATYSGQTVEKPTIGDALKPLEPEDIPDAVRVIMTASFFGFAVFYLLALKVGILTGL